MTPVVSVEHVSKVYRLRHGGHAGGLRHAIQRAAVAPWRWVRGRSARAGETQHSSRGTVEDFWALRDVSFSVATGEVVGLIGRNGAGKSTLLKIVSRITEPTSGRVRLRGRVSSLLEVGTGFHPELTGRENIFLNGAILGMARAEIARKFDEMVAFAEVDRFLDTPVKHYSSGMYVRLAFAVAAHLEPDILVVDEVLAVGDSAFQKKCLGKMQDVSRNEGRTVLFVSHNMAAIRNLCSRVILLHDGAVVREHSNAEQAISEYLTVETDGEDATIMWSESDAPRAQGFVFRRAWIEADRGRASGLLANDEPFSICAEYTLAERMTGVRIGFRMETMDGTVVCGATDAASRESAARGPGTFITRCQVPGHLLNEGRYQVRFGAEGHGTSELSLLTPFCLAFTVEMTGDTVGSGQRLPGVVRPLLSWHVTRAEAPPS